MKPTLMSWLGHDYTQPEPWATVACPACGERELARAPHRKPTEFVCMTCGCVAVIRRMKAITVRQPWAWCIATGHKPEENRGWTTKYRGPLAIHAGGTVDVDSVDMVKSMLVELGVVPTMETPVPDQHLTATGAVIAVADLVGICTDSARCRCSMWAGLGQNHWKLRNVEPLADPVPARGRQSLWDIGLPAVAADGNHERGLVAWPQTSKGDGVCVRRR